MDQERRMPAAASAYVEEEKVTGYLLSLEHPDGRTKAVFFMSFGFRAEDWEKLSEALLRHARENELVDREETPFGVQYAVEGSLRTPDGRDPTVRSVWEQRRGARGPRLITAYPGKGRRER
ncbi:MAG: DUF6883 domain-containing protein [Actinomycetota bacterium]